MPTPPVWSVQAPLLRIADLSRTRGTSLRRDGVRLLDGIYVESRAWSDCPVWDRVRWLIEARTLRFPGTVFCCLSALQIWGVPVGLTPIEITVAATTRSQSGTHPSTVRMAGQALAGFPKLRVHHHPVLEPVSVGDFTVMPLADALGHVLGRETLERSIPAADAALRLGVVGREQLSMRVESPAVRTVRAQGMGALAAATGLSESPGESLSRVTMMRLGVQAPVLQRTVVIDGREYRPDYTWPDANVAGEFDGRDKYLSPSMRGRGRDEWDVLRAEKQRDAALRSRFRAVVHWSAEDRTPPSRLRGILQAAGVPVDIRTATRLR